MVVLLGMWALFQSLGTESVLKKTLYAYTIYSAALTPVILAAFYSAACKCGGSSQRDCCGHAGDVLLGCAGREASLAGGAGAAGRHFPALVASLLCLVVVSLATKPPKREQVALFFPE